MSLFVRSLTAEALKLRRTLALWMMFVAPLIPVSFVFPTSSRWGGYYPWLLPLNSMFAERSATAVILGPAGACIALCFMLFDLSRRDVS